MELLMCPTEKGLFQALLEDPEDVDTRNAYVDFLKDQGRLCSARLVETRRLLLSHYPAFRNNVQTSHIRTVIFPEDSDESQTGL